MKRLVLPLLLVLVACGDAEPPVPVPAPGPTVVPAPEPEPEIGAFTLETFCGVPDRSPPVLVRGDGSGVKIAVHRLDEPSLPLGWGQPGQVVFEGAAKSDEWYFVPPMSSGIYRVTATRGEERQERWLVVSDLAVIVKRAAREALVWVVDAADGSPVAGARVVGWHGDRTREGVTDRSGVFRFEVPGSERLEVLVNRNGRIGYVAEEGFPTKDVVAFLLLDRTAYEPGDEIQVAGIYRKRNGDYRLVKAPGVRLLIRDERGATVAAADPEEHHAGFFHGRITLPAEPPPGPLDLVADLSIGEAAVSIPIVRPPPTGFTVSLFEMQFGGLNNHAGSQFFADATDTTGRRLAGAEVRYRMEQWDRGRFTPILVGKGRLTADDMYSWDPDPRPALYGRARVEVVDSNGLSVERQQTIGRREPDGTSPVDPGFGITASVGVARVGDEVVVRIPVTPELQGRSVLLTMEGGALGPHTVEKLSGYLYQTTFLVPDRPGAVLRFEATTVEGREVQRGADRVIVIAGSRRFFVTVEPEDEQLVVRVPEEIPAGTRALVVVGSRFGTRIEDVFYGGADESGRTVDSLAFVDRESPAAETSSTRSRPGGPSRPSPAPLLWLPDLRLEDGTATIPFALPEDSGQVDVAVAVATPDHRFGTGHRVLGVPRRSPPPAAAPRAPPPPRLRSRSRPGLLPNGVSACSLDLPTDATDARLEILVTRGPLAAAAAAARSEMTRSTETTDGAIASFLPALIVWRTARDDAARLGIHEADVRAATRAALARIYARQAEDGGFAPWDGALSDTATTARVLEALLDASPWVAVDKERIRRAVARLAEVESSDDATAALIFHALSKAGHRFRTRIEKRFPQESWNRLPPRALARLIDVWYELDESRTPRLYAALRRQTRPGPGEMVSWSDTPGRDAETTAIVVDNLVDDMDGAVRFLLDRRTGASWADPRTATAAVRALLTQVSTVTPEEGEPVPLRIRIESGLIAAVTLAREELSTTGRSFDIEDGSVPRGRFEVEFTRGGAGDVDVVAQLKWRATADGPEGDDIVVVRSALSRITTSGRKPHDGPAARGDTLLVTVTVETKEPIGPFFVDCPLAAGTIALPARIFDIGTPPGVGRTDRRDRVRFLVPAMKVGTVQLEFVVRTTFAGTFVLRSVTATGQDSGAHLGASLAGKLEIR